MGIKNDQAGLTLVELLVTIVVASIVTLSACSMLLFGLRINNQSTKNSIGQNTVQVLMEALEDVAAEAKDLKVIAEPDAWQIENGDGTVLFSYVSSLQTIYTGRAIDPSTGTVIGTPFLTNVFASSATYKDKLLTIDVQTAQDNYSTSIYCRMGTEEEAIHLTAGEKVVQYLNGDTTLDITGLPFSPSENRLGYIKLLASQIDSRGQIRNNGTDTGTYYSEWYIGGYDEVTKPGWNKNTPWCGCFVSWGIANSTGVAIAVKEANVENLRNAIPGANKLQNTTEPKPGDLIFFNFDEDSEADHVGVVLLVYDGYIYTIEGNTAGKVAVRMYSANYETREIDPRIIEYRKIFS